ncbi:MAG: hypothetical protein ACD_13C00140G0001 [uncultured bacterium]|nr:MAG: hypothetical protein ACD_13C00140G0001 [uncultured bacterium]
MGTLEHEARIDFEAIGKKLQSAENLNEDEKFLVFSRATNFASDLIDQKLERPYTASPMDIDVRSHMTVIVLDRVVSQYQAGSTMLFDNLKKAVCELFVIKNNDLTDERLCTLLSSSLDEYFAREINDEVSKKMGFIRSAVESIVPNKV